MNDLTQKTIECISSANDLAVESSHGLLTNLHLAKVLFEDDGGVAQQAVLRQGNDDTLR